MRQYQWLLFDADGTLFDYDRAEAVALREVFLTFGLPFQPAYLDIYRSANAACWRAFENREMSLSVLKVRRFEALLKAIRVSHSAETFGAAYLDCLAERPELIADAAEVLQSLQGKYRMAILTNGLTAVQRGRLARSEIRRHFEEVIISEEIGAAKPAKEFFDVTWRRLGNPRRCEALMIGDGWSSDITGAIQYGVGACWFNPARKPKPSGGGEMVREIAMLRELTDWLA